MSFRLAPRFTLSTYNDLYLFPSHTNTDKLVNMSRTRRGSLIFTEQNYGANRFLILAGETMTALFQPHDYLAIHDFGQEGANPLILSFV